MSDYGGESSGFTSDETNREVTRLWRAWRTVLQMCKDRGYQLSQEELDITLDRFKSNYTDNGIPNRARMTMQATPSPEMITRMTPLPTKSNPNPDPICGTIWVEFAKDLSMGIKQMRQFAQHIQGNNFHTGILVTQASLTPAAMKIPPVVQPAIIETFQEQDLLVNITHHELVPRHILLSAEEKKKLLERYRLKETQLPRIQQSDPVARYLGLRRGQVVKIIRKSETAGRYATYRWVI